MRSGRNLRFRVALIGFSVVLVLAWFCYRPALGGDFQLDDRSNLAGLSQVEDWNTALDFVLSGKAGPSGRPVALTTFALQADAWDDDPAAFLRVNILIHLGNAVLLAWFLFRLALLRGTDRGNAALVAGFAAGAWVLMPLLASSSMLVVQRMTTLSATFVFLGLAAYLTARVRLDRQPAMALIAMSASLVTATVLATLSKESGALLPVLVLALELTVLERPSRLAARTWRIWQAIFLLTPLLLILAYLGDRAVYPEAMELRRGYGVWERVLTEAHILWSYLAKATVGIPGQLGVFQTAPEVRRSILDPFTLLASLSWVALFVAAIVWRRRYPLAALAVLWFLAGHLLESSVVPLELYFEHRNYVPVVGPLFAAGSLLVLGPARLRQVATVAAPLFLLLSAYWLFIFASLWGEPSTASRYWALRYPDSVRAVTTMASYQLAEEGPVKALQTIDRFVIRHPEHAYLRIQELNLLCLFSPDQDHGATVRQVKRELADAVFTFTAGDMLSQLFSTVAGGQCRDVDSTVVVSLAETLHGNAPYAADKSYNQFHFKLLAAIARHQGDYAATVGYLREAIAHRPSSELNMMMVTAMAGEGDFDAAEKFIDDALQRQPANPLRAAEWRRDLRWLRAYVRELRATSQ